MQSTPLQALRKTILADLPLYIFLTAYFGLTVLGNLLYATPFGADLPAVNISDFSWDKVAGEFTPGFWLLIFLPFVLCPIAIGVKKLTAPFAETSASYIPELPKAVYLALTTALYVYAIYNLVDAHALGRFLSATQAIAAVENRFALLADIGFKPQMALKSLLVFLSIYGVIRAEREAGFFWPILTGLNVLVLTSCLILLNMKWPAVVFILTLGVCLFIVSNRHPYIKAIGITVAGMILYLSLSVVVLRWFPETDSNSADFSLSTHERHIGKGAPIGVKNTVFGIADFSPRILVGALNRMAMAVPYYYDFSSSCKPTLSRIWIKRDLSCEPTLLVYTELFGDDGFKGRGTAPAAVNIYGYALAGWSGAILSTTIAMTILGLFLALWSPAQTNAVFAAAFVMGCYTAYFFSQLPLEGPLIYDHGIWWALLVLFWMAIYWGAVKMGFTRKETTTIQ